MGNHTIKVQPVQSKWDIAYRASLPGATTTLEVDFSKIPTTTYNKLVKMIEMYPENPGRGYGWASQCRKLFNALSDYYDLPLQHIDPTQILIKGLADKALWEEVYELCYADAVAHRMETGRTWPLNDLLRYKDEAKAKGYLNYWRGAADFYRSFLQTDTYARIVEYLREKEKGAVEKMYQTAAYGACIRFQLTN